CGYRGDYTEVASRFEILRPTPQHSGIRRGRGRSGGSLHRERPARRTFALKYRGPSIARTARSQSLPLRSPGSRGSPARNPRRGVRVGATPRRAWRQVAGVGLTVGGRARADPKSAFRVLHAARQPGAARDTLSAVSARTVWSGPGRTLARSGRDFGHRVLSP